MSEYLTESKRKFVKYMMQRRFAESTIKQYLGYIDKLSIVDSRLYRLSNEQIQDFILESASASGQNCKINALQLFFRLNHPQKRIKVFIRPRTEKKLIQVLTMEEVWKILNVITDIKQRAIYTGIYLHGLRRSEILSLKYKHIDRERKQMIIRDSKGGKDRIVPLHPLWLPFLEAYARREHHTRGYNKAIFAPYSTSSIYHFIKDKAKKAGINKRVYPHLLRDCYATHLLEQGIDTRFIQDILGHAKLETTQKYTHISSQFLSQITLQTPSLQP